MVPNDGSVGTKGGAAERSGWYYLGVALLLLMAMVVVMAIVGNV